VHACTEHPWSTSPLIISHPWQLFQTFDNLNHEEYKHAHLICNFEWTEENLEQQLINIIEITSAVVSCWGKIVGTDPNLRFLLVSYCTKQSGVKCWEHMRDHLVGFQSPCCKAFNHSSTRFGWAWGKLWIKKEYSVY
jgi:hypothetical protein